MPETADVFVVLIVSSMYSDTFLMFVSVALMLNVTEEEPWIVLLVGELKTTNGFVASIVTVLDDVVFRLPALSFTWTLYVLVPSVCDDNVILHVVPVLVIVVFVEPSSNKQLFGFVSVNVRLTVYEVLDWFEPLEGVGETNERDVGLVLSIVNVLVAVATLFRVSFAVIKTE